MLLQESAVSPYRIDNCTLERLHVRQVGERARRIGSKDEAYTTYILACLLRMGRTHSSLTCWVTHTTILPCVIYRSPH